MIVQERKAYHKLFQARGLLCRLPKNHACLPEIDCVFAESILAFIEKTALDGYLAEFCPIDYLADPDVFIFHDLNMLLNQEPVRIDTAILAQHMLLVIEMTEHFGTVLFDRPDQPVIELYNGEEFLRENPIAEVNHKAKLIGQWMKEQGFPDIPVVPIVLISNPKAEYRSISPASEMEESVFYMVDLPFIIESAYDQYPKCNFSAHRCDRLLQQIINAQIPDSIDLLQKYSIDPSIIQSGISCQSCQDVSVSRVNGDWICGHCGEADSHAHHKSLLEYFVLKAPTITARKFQQWMHLDSLELSVRLLEDMQLSASENNGEKIYHQPASFVKFIKSIDH